MRSNASRAGKLLISVDLEPGSSSTQLEVQRSLEKATVRLLALLTKFRTTATWSAREPDLSPAARAVAADPAEHDLAVLAGADWAGSDASRSAYSRGLSRHVAAAALAGRTLSTLVLEAGRPAHDDLTIKYGIKALRPLAAKPAGPVRSARAALRGWASRDRGQNWQIQPEAVRYGLWQLPVSLELGGSSRRRGWLPGGGVAGRTTFALDKAAAEAGTVHLAVKAGRLCLPGNPGWDELTAVLEHAAALRTRQELEIETLASAATRLSQPRFKARPAQSILRLAA